jgi:hypothetical protein
VHLRKPAAVGACYGRSSDVRKVSSSVVSEFVEELGHAVKRLGVWMDNNNDVDCLVLCVMCEKVDRIHVRKHVGIYSYDGPAWGVVHDLGNDSHRMLRWK